MSDITNSMCIYNCTNLYVSRFGRIFWVHFGTILKTKGKKSLFPFVFNIVCKKYDLVASKRGTNYCAL